MKKIPLTQGKYAIGVDDDFDRINQYKWHYISTGYAATHEGKLIILMHRLLMNTPRELQVDHINMDKLDNRKSNLRNCTKQQQQFNTKAPKNNKLGLKGVYWDKSRNKFVARIMINYKGIFLGRFIDKSDAIKAYNKALIKYGGEFARINTL